MGNAQTCCQFGCYSRGAVLLAAAANGDLRLAQELLKRNPKAALYHSYNDKTSPLLQASARGHFELVQCIVETAVCVEGVDKAKRLVIDHANSKRQTPLMVACKHGHADCVEYLAQNGANPLVADERRHNTCLHFAVLYGHSDCLDKLLGSFVMAASGQQGAQRLVAQQPCIDEDGAQVSFVNCHNGWGLTALHIAVFQGSVNAVRTLLRHGAAVDAVITTAKVDNNPICCSVGSNALHIAAVIGNVSMAKVILEAQDATPGVELRSRLDSAGLRPIDYAARARNAVLVHLLDERLPVTLLRQIWMNYSMEQTMPPRHQTLGAMLQKLKLMFNLEIIAVQRNLATAAEEEDKHGQPLVIVRNVTHPSSMRRALAQVLGGGSLAPGHQLELVPGMGAAQQRAIWLRRQDDVTVLLNSVTHLYDQLQTICKKPEEGPEWPGSVTSLEAVLDFILSTLITPRTVSSIIHAAKKMVCSNITAMAASPNTAPPAFPSESEVQQGIALLTTALRAVDTCLQAVLQLSFNSGALSAATAVAGQQQPHVGLSGSPPFNLVATATTSSGPIHAVPTGGITTGSVAAASIAPTTSAHGPSSTPSSSFTAATARGTIGTHVPSFTSSAPTDGASLLLPELQQQPTAAVGAMSTQAPASPAPALGVGADRVTGSSSGGQPAQSTILASGAGAVQAATAPSTVAGQPLAIGLGTPSPNWSAQLNSLVAQLQWDIGVQRHRRRRQHAAAVAARAAAAAALAGGEDGSSAAPNAAAPPTVSVAGPVTDVPGSDSLGLTSVSMGVRSHLAGMAAQLAQYTGGTSWISINPAVLQNRARWQREAVTPANVPSVGGAAGAPASPVSQPAAALLADVRRSMLPGGSVGAVAAVGPLAGTAVTLPAEGTAAASLHHSQSGVGSVTAWDDDAVGTAPAAPAVGEIVPRADSLVADGNATGSAAPAPAPLAVIGATGAVNTFGAIPSAAVPTASVAGLTVKRHALPDQALLGTLGEMSEDNLSGGEEQASVWSDDDSALCSICMDQPVAVQVSGCQHGLCVQCAFQLTVKGRELPSCPFCRQKIPSFEVKRVQTPVEIVGGRGKGGVAGGAGAGAKPLWRAAT